MIAHGPIAWQPAGSCASLRNKAGMKANMPHSGLRADTQVQSAQHLLVKKGCQPRGVRTELMAAASLELVVIREVPVSMMAPSARMAGTIVLPTATPSRATIQYLRNTCVRCQASSAHSQLSARSAVLPAATCSAAVRADRMRLSCG